jgi:hypothetical protein
MLLYRHSLTSCTGLGLRRLVPVTPSSIPLKHLHELSEATQESLDKMTVCDGNATKMHQSFLP